MRRHPAARCWPLAALLLASLCARAAAAQREGADRLAPAGSWYARGGNAAHSGATRTRALDTRPERAFRFEAAGAIEGEPLVWGTRALLEVRGANAQRRLEALDLGSGARSAQSPWYTSAEPLAPALWGARIWTRTGERRLEWLLLRESSFRALWAYAPEADVHAPLCFGQELYARVGDGIERLEPLRGVLWRSEGRFRGELALAGGELYALRYDAAGNAALVALDRQSGAAREIAGLGHHNGELPAPDTRVELELCLPQIFVHLPLPLAGQPRTGPCVLRVELAGASPKLFLQAAAPALADWRDGWLGWVDDAEQKPVLAWAHALGASGTLALANSTQHAEFCERPLALALCAPLAYAGARAFEVERRRIAWRLPVDARARAVPIEGGLLLCTGERGLECWREARSERVAWLRAQGAQPSNPGAPPAASPPVALPPVASPPVASPPSPVAPARALLADGRVLSGALELDSAENALHADGQSIPLSEVALALDGAGAPVCASDLRRLPEAVVELVERGLAEDWAALAREAVRAKDVDLLERLYAAALALGSQERGLADVQRHIEQLRAAPQRVVPGLRANALAREAELELALPRALVHAAQGLDGAMPSGAAPYAALGARLELLRAAFERAPELPEALAALRALLPAGLELPADADPLDWLDFAQAAHTRGVALCARAQPGAAASDPCGARLADAQRAWRADLVALHSPHLAVLSAPNAPGSLAHCLAFGELVCDTLSALPWPAAGAAARAPETLQLYLYEDQAEYLRQSPSESSEARRALEWSAGHYDRAARLSRIFLPADAAGFEAVRSTYAHELAHHWLDVACPALAQGDRSSARQKGYWIVEAFACFVEELEYDESARSARARPAQSESVDLLAHFPAGAGLDWAQLFGATQLELGALPAEADLQLPSGLVLGGGRTLSGVGRFYTQAAASWQYLWQREGGARRGELLGALLDYYRGGSAAADTQACFGLDARALGAAVEAFCRATAEQP